MSSNAHSSQREALYINILDDTYRITGLDLPQYRALSEYYPGWCSSHPMRHARVVACTVRSVSSPVHSRPVIVNREYRIIFHHAADCVVMYGNRFKAVIHKSRDLRTQIDVFDEGDADIVVSAIDNVLRTLVAYRLILNDGLLLHSAAVVVDDKAMVFFGRSGSGKSTIARAARDQGYAVLSDDLNAIIRRKNRYFARQLPLTGDLGRTGTGHSGTIPLAGIFRLSREHNRAGVHSMTRAQALAGLMVCSPYVNADPNHRRSLLDFMDALSQAHPLSSFRFELDNSFKQQVKPLSAKQ